MLELKVWKLDAFAAVRAPPSATVREASEAFHASGRWRTGSTLSTPPRRQPATCTVLHACLHGCPSTGTGKCLVHQAYVQGTNATQPVQTPQTAHCSAFASSHTWPRAAAHRPSVRAQAPSPHARCKVRRPLFPVTHASLGRGVRRWLGACLGAAGLPRLGACSRAAGGARSGLGGPTSRTEAPTPPCKPTSTPPCGPAGRGSCHPPLGLGRRRSSLGRGRGRGTPLQCRQHVRISCQTGLASLLCRGGACGGRWFAAGHGRSPAAAGAGCARQPANCRRAAASGAG